MTAPVTSGVVTSPRKTTPQGPTSRPRTSPGQSSDTVPTPSESGCGSPTFEKSGRSFTKRPFKPRNEYFAGVTSEPRARRGREEFEGATHCRAMTHRIDYVNDVLRMRIPRRCLGRPRWVRVTLLNAVVNQRTETFYVDNPHNHQAFPESSTRRLYRG